MGEGEVTVSKGRTDKKNQGVKRETRMGGNTFPVPSARALREGALRSLDL